MSTEQTGLERSTSKAPEIIRTPDDYRDAVRTWMDKKFNVLTPFAEIGAIAPSHAVFPSVVQISVEPASEEIYANVPWLKGGAVALAKRGLRKIAEGLGISTRLEYISVGAIRQYWHVKAIASYRGVDGATVEREGSQEWDLRDGSDRMKGWTPAQIQEARKHGLRQCETRAINAAIRECGCGIKQAYQRDELARPFLAVRVMFTPNMDNPEERRIVLERALGSTNALYPHRELQAPPADPFEDDTPTAPKHVGSGTTSQAPTAKPNPDDPPTVDSVRIVKVEPKSGETNGRKWMRWTIVDSTGTEHSTFDKKLAEFAEKALAAKQWVEIAEEQDGQYRNLLEITAAGQQPGLPNLDQV